MTENYNGLYSKGSDFIKLARAIEEKGKRKKETRK